MIDNKSKIIYCDFCPSFADIPSLAYLGYKSTPNAATIREAQEKGLGFKHLCRKCYKVKHSL